MYNEFKNMPPLHKEQKEAIALLSIGTFLEHFDLLLYIHMIPILNETFFPKVEDPKWATMLAALVFCTTYICRPFGALIFGYLGDNFGRKIPVVITTFIMALCCLIIANTKPYSEIGIAATWIITLCRIGQGMSSMGEIVGAEIYLTESIKPPQQYFAVSLMAFCAAVGCAAALALSSLVTSFGFDWRIGFWFGACVALVGVIARTTLKETQDFANAQFRIKNHLQKNNITLDLLKTSAIKEKINKVIIAAYSLIHCGWPLCFYLGFIYCGNILKNSFGYTSEQVIHHNFLLSIAQLFGFFFLRIYLCRKVHPLKILKVILWIFAGAIIFLPYLLNNCNSPLMLLIIQTFIIIFAIDMAPGTSIFYSFFPIFKRFTYAGLAFGVSRAVINVIISLGCIYATDKFGYYGLMLIIIPILGGYAFSIYYFCDLNKVIENYHKKNHNMVPPLSNLTELV